MEFGSYPNNRAVLLKEIGYRLMNGQSNKS